MSWGHDVWHMPLAGVVSTLGCMSERRLRRWTSGCGAAVSLVMAAPVLSAQLGGDDPIRGPGWLWWTILLAYVLVLVLLVRVADRWPWARYGSVVVLIGSGGMAVLLAPEVGSVAVLSIVTAAVAAVIGPPWVAAATVVAQCVLVVVVVRLEGGDAAVTLVQVAIFAVLQTSAVVLIRSLRREARSRAELAAANAQLRAASALMAESSRSTERLRIARDLHDLVGHQLTAMSLELEIAGHHATPPVSEHVARSRRFAKELLADVRGVVGQLRHQNRDLRAVLEEITRGISHPKIHLQVDDAVGVDEDRFTALVRCSQELITNTVRHADADNLWIEITVAGDDHIRLASHDDGRGSTTLNLGNGLMGICERVEGLGGSVSIEHRDGFRVVAEVSGP